MRKSSIKRGIGATVLWLLAVLNSGYLLQVAGGTFASILQYSTMVVGCILFFVHMVMSKATRKASSRQVFFWYFLFVSLLSMIVNRDGVWLWLNTVSIVFIAYYIVEKYPTETIISTFINTVYIIALISLFFMAWISIAGIPQSFSMVSTTATENECYNYIVFFYPKLWSSSLGRNRGIFWEPGLFATYIVIALTLEICCAKKINKIKASVFVLTTITTLSTAGIVLLIVPFIALVGKTFTGRYHTIGSMILLVGMITALFFRNEIVSWLVEINPTLFSKLLGEEQTAVTRIGAPLLNLQLFLENPLLGKGFNGATQEFLSRQILFKADSQTSTSLYMLSALGFSGVYYTFYWIKNILKIHRFDFMTKIVIIVLFMSILNKEPHAALLGTWMILFLLNKYGKKK